MEYVRTLVIVLLAATVVMTSNLAVCQETPSARISSGSYLRVSAASLSTPTIEGTVAGFENGLLLLETDPGKSPLRINMVDVSRVEIRTEESTKGKDAGWGAAFGALGWLALVAVTDGCRGDLYSNEVCYGSAIVFGGIVGGLAGLIVSHGDRWEPAPLVDIGRHINTTPDHQGQLAGHRRGLGLSLSVMF